MQDLLLRVWDNLIARTEGPMHLRFVIQPAVSIYFAIQAGRLDAKTNTIPFLWRFVTAKGKRKAVAKEGWKHSGKIFMMGLAMDLVYQAVVIYKLGTEENFYPLESIIVAFLLAIVPYVLIRGPLSRLITLYVSKQNATSESRSSGATALEDKHD
jgi:hypothetical protein